MKQAILLFILTIYHSSSYCQNALPIIKDLVADWSIDRTSIEINFATDDIDNDKHDIDVKLTYNFGLTKNQFLIPIQKSGDIGTGIPKGNNKKIILEFSQAINEGVVLNLIVSDNEPLLAKDIINQVNSNQSLAKNLARIEGRRHAKADSVHLENSREFLLSKMSNYFTTDELISSTPTLKCINFVADQIGTKNPEEIYVIDAHYDGVAISPGADDNGSGVVGVLEAMHVLSQYACDKTIRYALFDLEELGLVGSNLYLSNQIHSADKIQGAINFEMIGYYSNEPNSQTLPTGFNILFPDAFNEVVRNQYRGNFITNVGNTISASLIAAYQKNATECVPNLKVISLTVPGKGELVPDLRRSDHASFWDKNIPALMLTDGANFRNKRYHTASDSAHYLDYNFMTQVIQASVASLIQLAGIKHAASKQYELSTGLSSTINSNSKNHYFFINNSILFIQNEKLKNSLVNGYNSDGKLVFTKSLKDENQIDLNPLLHSNGVYFLNIQKNNANFNLKFLHESN